jgi:hypothetical protein
VKFTHPIPLYLLKILVITLLVLPVAALADGPEFSVRQYGAVGDGTNIDTAALQKAIDAAASAGGGTVVFPPGSYLSGSLHLKSHVALQLDAGTILLGSPHQPDYDKVNFHGLLLADGQQDITICGHGVIDGQGALLAADTVRLWKKRKLPDAKEDERPVLINFRNCTNIEVQDITLKDSACWVEDYLDCDHLTVENISVRSDAAENNDGIDIDGCVHTVLRGCDINSEDDGICLKSEDRVCNDVLVENCRVSSECNALKFGTRSTGGFTNIICRNLVIHDTDQSGIALEIVDGGTMANVHVSNIQITNCNNAIFIRLGHRNVNGPVGSLSDVTISNVTAEIPNWPPMRRNKFYRPRPTLTTASITGLPGFPVRDVTLEDITLVYGGIGSTPPLHSPDLDTLNKVPECAALYPESSMFGTLPAWGFYCRHAEGIKFNNITLRVADKDYRPALLCDDVRDIELNGFEVGSAGSEPVIVLNDVQGATIHGSSAPPGAVNFVKSMGNTRDVQVGD